MRRVAAEMPGRGGGTLYCARTRTSGAERETLAVHDRGRALSRSHERRFSESRKFCAERRVRSLELFSLTIVVITTILAIVAKGIQAEIQQTKPFMSAGGRGRGLPAAHGGPVEWAFERHAEAAWAVAYAIQRTAHPARCRGRGAYLQRDCGAHDQPRSRHHSPGGPPGAARVGGAQPSRAATGG